MADGVLAHSAAVTLGLQGLKALAAEYVAKAEHYFAAKTKFAETLFVTADIALCASLLQEAHQLLEQSNALTSREGQQFEYDVLAAWYWHLVCNQIGSESERTRVLALKDERAQNPAVYKEPISVWIGGVQQGSLDTGLVSRLPPTDPIIYNS